MSSDPATQRLTRNLMVLADALAKATRERIALETEATAMRRQLVQLGASAERAPLTEAAAQPARTRRGRAAVVSWDLAHNPAGRAYALYDLLSVDWEPQLIGPLWSRFGGALWPPLEGMALDMRAFPAKGFEDFFTLAALEASRTRFDLVHVCKPRFPSLLLGYLIKLHSGCPMIVDVDDHELAFFEDRTPASFEELLAGGTAAFDEPYEALLTRACEALIGEADAVTVSNVALRDRFGGHIVRHARDETVFDPARYDAPRARAAMGIAEDEFALMFVGTPRAHKGLGEIAAALDAIGDARITLNIVGDFPDPNQVQAFARYTQATIRFFPNAPFGDLAGILAAADAVPILQDPSDPIAAFQIPAKISDATALGKPVLTTAVPPLRDVIAAGGAIAVTPETLAETLRGLAAAKRAGHSDAPAIRRFFLGELSKSVNATRLARAIDEAQAASGGAYPQFERMAALAAETFGARVAATAAMDGPAPSPTSGEPIDVAFFWKQNDTGLYGRRSDMVVKHLLQSPRIGRVMLFDAPMTSQQLIAAENELLSNSSQNGLVLRNSMARWLGALDTDRCKQRLFIAGDASRTALYGRDLPAAESYPEWVAAELAAAGFAPERTIAWVCPVVWDFAAIADAIPFALRVADLIDDQRAWQAAPKYLERVDVAYRETLARCDVVFTNCDPVADAFRDHAPQVHVVPNGAELFAAGDTPAGPHPLLAGVSGPIIGYVGNLRDRIDWPLLAQVVRARPQWSFVLAGSTHDSPQSIELADFPNVHLTGVVEYAGLPALLRAFDVAIMPHERNALTARMNPLKIYNYFSAGLPIVSSDVANLDEMTPFVRVATNAEDFIAAIEAALAAPATVDPARAATLAAISWQARVTAMLDRVWPALAGA